jgi:Xaa-Pro aminopeptidase
MVSSGVYVRRLGRLRSLLGESGFSGVLVDSRVDVFYLTGRDCGRVLVTDGDAILWVKGFYRELYGSHYGMRGFPYDVRDLDRKVMAGDIRSTRKRRFGVASHSCGHSLRDLAGRDYVVSDILKRARGVKFPDEVGFIRKSCRIAVSGMRLARDLIGSGVRELDVVADVEARMRRMGSERAPFGEGMLLASGRRSSDIHARAGLNRIGRGLVVVDLGAVYGGYFSDMTRTYGVGRLSSLESEVKDFVECLRDETVDMIRPGVTAGEVYDFVNSRVECAGFRFHHLPGHGVGLEIHENPSLKSGSDVVLERNMVFTIEPGIYVPGRFGARFEDTVLLTGRGCERLTGGV